MTLQVETESALYSPPDLRVRIAEDDSTIEIILNGELDIATGPVAQQAIDEAFTSRPRQLVLNLSQLSFMDSTGVYLTLRAHDAAAANDIDLTLIPGPPAVQRLFAIAQATNERVQLPWAQSSTRGAADGL